MLVLCVYPRRTCAARVTVLVLCVCLSICLSGTTFYGTTRNEAMNLGYQEVCFDGVDPLGGSPQL